MTTKIQTRAMFATAAIGLGLIALPTAAAARPSSSTVNATLTQLNGSGVNGSATVTVTGNRLEASFDAIGLLAGSPHAAHIHFGKTAEHECPTQADDGGNGRLTTLEGLPFYGPVVVSFTLFGDTSARSVLAIDRFSTADDGTISYDRAIKTQGSVAKAIAAGQGVVVIHGVDYEGGVPGYDFAAGVSDLNPDLPAEATDLAACGVLED